MPPIGQIGKRLEIIKTAISLTDAETIAMQCSKLRVHKNDKLLGNILSVLDDENYIQATKLIDRYLHGPYDDQEQEAFEAREEEQELPNELPEEEVDEAALEEERRRRAREEEELIKKFGLFMEKAKQEEYNPIDEEEMMLMSQAAASEKRLSEEEELTPAPRQPSTEEIMAQLNSIVREELPVSDTISKSRQTSPLLKEKKIETASLQEQEQEEEDFSFEIKETSIDDSKKTTLSTEKISALSSKKQSPEKEPEKTENEAAGKTAPESETIPQGEAEKSEKEVDTEYEPISYIDQKFRNMRNQYPQVEESSERFESVEKLLYMISLEGYNESDIEEVIQEVFELKSEGKLAEAAHLLLIAAATESLYAQFVLARELYKGEILQKDLPEAFTQINRLALDDYPEAVCDLAQLYEYGIGIPKDKKKAFSLYEDALELGVQRADRHLKRMEEESKGFLRKLFKR